MANQDQDHSNELLMMRIFALLVIVLLFAQRIQIDDLKKAVADNDKSIQSIQQKLKD